MLRSQVACSDVGEREKEIRARTWPSRRSRWGPMFGQTYEHACLKSCTYLHACARMQMEFKKRQKAKLHPSTRKKVEMRGNLF